MIATVVVDAKASNSTGDRPVDATDFSSTKVQNKSDAKSFATKYSRTRSIESELDIIYSDDENYDYYNRPTVNYFNEKKVNRSEEKIEEYDGIFNFSKYNIVLLLHTVNCISKLSMSKY